MIGVMAQHRAAVGNIDDASSVPSDLLTACRQAWDDVLNLGEVHGYRNAQATVLAPTGTISFMMDCDTTGVEPDFSLVKSKKLVGGGEITIVNKSVPMSLDKLGYAPAEVEEIVAFVDERNTVVGAPFLKAEHYPVYDCAVGDRAIHYMGHVKMMGAVQPFISGAISKTVNLPETVTVDEVAQLFVESWKLGVKAIAIYRDNCKVAQPLSGKKDGGAQETLVSATAAGAADAAPPPAGRPGRGRPQVPRRRLRGLHPRRTVRRRDAGRHLRRHREGRHDAGGPDEQLHDLGLARPAVRRAARGLRLEVRAHALRAERARRTTRTSASRSRSSTTCSAGWASGSSPWISRRRSGSCPRRCGLGWRRAIATAGMRLPLRRRRRWRPRRPGRPRCSTPSRTHRSAPSAAGGWCGPGAVTPAGTAGRTPAVARSRSASGRGGAPRPDALPGG